MGRRGLHRAKRTDTDTGRAARARQGFMILRMRRAGVDKRLREDQPSELSSSCTTPSAISFSTVASDISKPLRISLEC